MYWSFFAFAREQAVKTSGSETPTGVSEPLISYRFQQCGQLGKVVDDVGTDLFQPGARFGNAPSPRHPPLRIDFGEKICMKLFHPLAELILVGKMGKDDEVDFEE